MNPQEKKLFRRYRACQLLTPENSVYGNGSLKTFLF
jgi:hypothetical protein